MGHVLTAPAQLPVCEGPGKHSPSTSSAFYKLLFEGPASFRELAEPVLWRAGPTAVP